MITENSGLTVRLKNIKARFLKYRSIDVQLLKNRKEQSEVLTAFRKVLG
jgi:hypothetical protein